MTGTVRLHRAFAAPPETVYRAFPEPYAIAHWLPHYGFFARHMRLTRRWAGGFRMSFRRFPT